MTIAATYLDIPLRGGRDYVHSTDLFAGLEQLVKTRFCRDAWLRKLVLRKPVHHQVEISFALHEAAFGSFEFWDGRAAITGWLLESAFEIDRRIDFDETPLVAAATLGPGRAYLQAPMEGYTSFEQMIVLFKLLCTQFRPGRWLFAALDLSAPFREGLALELERRETILGRGITAELRQDGQGIGCARMALPAGAGSQR